MGSTERPRCCQMFGGFDRFCDAAKDDGAAAEGEEVHDAAEVVGKAGVVTADAG